MHGLTDIAKNAHTSTAKPRPSGIWLVLIMLHRLLAIHPLQFRIEIRASFATEVKENGKLIFLVIRNPICCLRLADSPGL
jgi:hypothetical protein